MRRAETEETLKPYNELIRSCIVDAWGECQTYLAPILFKLNACAIANVVFSLMTSNARERFEGVKGVKIVTKNGLFILSINGAVAIRFKKLGKNRLPRGIRTQQAIDFSGQIPLPGVPSKRNLFAGYMLNILQTDIQEVYIVCPDGEGLDWYYPIKAATMNNVVDVSKKNEEKYSDRAVGLKPEFEAEEAKKNGGNDGGNK